MKDLKTLKKETACGKDLFAKVMGLKTTNDEIIPDDCFRFHNHIGPQFDMIVPDDKVEVPSEKREWVFAGSTFRKKNHRGIKHFVATGYLRRNLRQNEELCYLY